MSKSIVLALTCLIAIGLITSAIHVGAEERKAVYVGSETCQGCHEAQYDSFMANSKKTKSYGSIQKMQKKLTPVEFKECFKCHTTGYGEPGGFTSTEATPGLKNSGCEVCHGPGSLHAESGDPVDLAIKVSLQVCSKCHSSDRVAAFGFKPILYAGAH
jgi:Cytochrome c554 and c-prime